MPGRQRSRPWGSRRELIDRISVLVELMLSDLLKAGSWHVNTCVESAESSARQLGGMENRGGLLRRTCPETSSHWAQHDWTGSRGAAV